MKRIHIIGSGPRTGTTLLAEAMHTCFYIDHHCEHEASICADEPDSGNIFMTKKPGEISAVKWPLRLNPDLYVICIIRDPRDSVVSRHGRRPDVYWTGLRYWKQFVKFFPALKQHPRFIYFRYEDFVSDPDRIQALIQQRIPFLKAICKFSEYHLYAKPSEDSIKALKSVRPIEPVSIGKWREHLPRIKQQLSIHGSITDELVEYGYETDSKWLSLLNGVAPDKSSSKSAEKLRLKDIYRLKRNEFKEVINITLRKIGFNPRVVKAPFVMFLRGNKMVLKMFKNALVKCVGWFKVKLFS